MQRSYSCTCVLCCYCVVCTTVGPTILIIIIIITDLQILGCELHQNTFGIRALPRKGLEIGKEGKAQGGIGMVRDEEGLKGKED